MLKQVHLTLKVLQAVKPPHIVDSAMYRAGCVSKSFREDVGEIKIHLSVVTFV